MSRPTAAGWHNPGMTTEKDDAGKWTLHGERTLYETEWLKLQLGDVSQPCGNRYEHHIVTLKPAVLVILLNESRDQILMGRRHRVVHDKWSWEVPGGLIELGESAINAAYRELQEETGYRPAQMHFMLTYEPMIGTVRCAHHLFLGLDARLIETPTEKNEGTFEWIRLDEAYEKIWTGEIMAVGTLVALLCVLTGGIPDQNGSLRPPGSE